EGSGTTLLDATDNGNHAAVTGSPSWVPGVEGQGLRFGGNGQYATAPDHSSLDVTGAITVSAWVRPERTGREYLVRKAEKGETDGYELTMADGIFFFRFN